MAEPTDGEMERQPEQEAAAEATPGAVVLRARDFRGWEVRDPRGEKLGTVAEILLGRDARIRYLDLDLGLLRKHVLVPLEQMEWGEQSFVLTRWTRDRLQYLPPFEGRSLTEPVLDEMMRAFPRFYGDAQDAPAPAAEAEPRVVPLSEAKDFKLEKGANNPRGWNVFGADGERLGTVAQVLVDPSALKVRYLEVDVYEDLFLLKDDRRVLVPIEMVDLKERGGDVLLERLSAAEAARLPAYAGGAVDPLVAERVQRAFGEG